MHFKRSSCSSQSSPHKESKSLSTKLFSSLRLQDKTLFNAEFNTQSLVLVFCRVAMGRAPCCDKNGLKKGPWTPEEDLKLINYIQTHGPGNWRTLPKNAGRWWITRSIPFFCRMKPYQDYVWICVLNTLSLRWWFRASKMWEELSSSLD